MKSINVIICVFLFFTFSCNNRMENRPGNTIFIDLEKDIDNQITLKVSDIGKSIEYIPLQTSDCSLIGKYPNIKVFKDYIICSSVNQPLKMFSKGNGNFIGTIGHIGEDPSGYLVDGFGNVLYFIDEEQEMIYVDNWNNDLKKYDLKGNYIGKIDVILPNHESNHLSSFYLTISNDTIWGYNKYPIGENVIQWFSYDIVNNSIINYEYISSLCLIKNEDIVSTELWMGDFVKYGGSLMRLYLSDDRVLYSVRESPSIWKRENSVFIKDNFVDTIFAVKEKELRPYMIFEMGDWSISVDQRYNIKGCGKKIYIDYILESNHIIYFHFHTGIYLKNRKAYSGIFDKQSQFLKIMESDSLIDDINNFMPLNIRQVTSDNEFIALLHPEDVLEYVKTHNINNEFLSGIKEEDNPIVVIIE